MSRTTRVASGFAINAATQAVVMLVGLWLTRFLLARIGQANLGFWLISTQVIGYLTLMDIGVVALVPRETAYAVGADPDARAGTLRILVGRTLRLALWQTLAVAAAAACVWAFLPISWHPLRGPLAMLFAAFVLLFPGRVLPALLQGLQDLTFLGALTFAGWALGTVTTVALVVAGHTLGALVAGWIATQIVLVAGAGVRLRGHHKEAAPTSLPPLPDGFARTYLSKGAWVSLTQVAQALLTGTDLLIIGRVLGPAVVVVYACTTKLPMVLANLAQALPAAAVPGLSELGVLGDRPSLARVHRALLQAVFLVSGAIATVVLAANGSFVEWWVGPQRYAGPALTWLVVASMLLHHVNMCAGYALFSLGQERRLAIVALADGAVTVAAALVLVAAIGPLGAPLGAIAGVALVSLPLNLRALARATGTGFGAYLTTLAPWAVRMALLAPAAAWVGTRWVAPSLAAAALAATAAAALYAGLMLSVALRDPLGEYTRRHLPALRWPGRT